MRRLCPVTIVCPSAQWLDGDSPITNLSSEAPDPLQFSGVGYAPWDPYAPPPLGGPDLFVYRDCFGVLQSTLSQEIANLLAASQAALCQNGYRFTNDQQTAFLSCSSTRFFWYTVQAGLFSGASVAAANAQALAYAQQQMARLYVCLGNPDPNTSINKVCLNDSIDSEQFKWTLTGNNSKANYDFTVIGSLPPGLSLTQLSHNSAGVGGVVSATGTFNYTIRATRVDIPWVFAESQCTMIVLGITNVSSLGTPMEGQAFNAQLNGAGGTGPYTYSVPPYSPDQLPSGLSLSSSGAISGTTDYMTARNYTILFVVRDSTGQSCTATWTTAVNVAPGPDWTKLSGGAVSHVGGGAGNIANFTGAGRSWSGGIQYPVFTGSPPYVDTLSASFFHTGAGANCRLNFIFSGCSGSTSGSINIYVNGFLVGAFAGPQGNGTRTFNFAVPAGANIPITINTTAGQGLIAIDQATPGAANLVINVFNL